MKRVFHLLPELEPFSVVHKRSVSSWVTNTLRSDEQALVIAPSTDGSTGFAQNRIRIAPALAMHRVLCGALGGIWPWRAARWGVVQALVRTLSDLAAGEVVWIHDRPELVDGLQKFARRRGAVAVLQMHHSGLELWPRPVTGSLAATVCVFPNCALQAAACAALPDLRQTMVLGLRADTSAFHPPVVPVAPRDRVLLIFSGVHAQDRDLEWFVEMMRLLEQRGSRVEGVVLRGPQFGSRGGRSRRRGSRSPLPRNVRFESFELDQEFGYSLRSADLFIWPGRWKEGATTEVHQALACGLPVAEIGATEACEELHGYTPSLTLSRDASHAASSLQHLEQEPAVLQSLAANAYKRYATQVMWAGVHEDYSGIVEASLSTYEHETSAAFAFAQA